MVGFLCSEVLAQKGGRGNINFRNKENKPYYFGLSLAYHSSNYQVFRSKNFNDQDQILSVQSVDGPGYNVNVITNLKVGRYFDFRLLPGFSFATHNLDYKDLRTQEGQRSIMIESVFVEVPFHVRYKSEPYNDMRVYVLGGLKYGFDLQSESRTRNQDLLLKVAPTDFSLEVGFGAQFFFPYFILSPEIKFSQGLNNVLILNSSQIQSNVLENVRSRAFTISFHFEG
ncbi:MAG: PorT family protein [Saprospiraceae bacterium]|nr:PorT family protein [Saprospiraceae bacterium]